MDADDVTMAVSIFYIQSIGKRLKKIVFNQAGEMLVASAALFCLIVDTVVVYLTQSPGLVA